MTKSPKLLRVTHPLSMTQQRFQKRKLDLDHSKESAGLNNRPLFDVKPISVDSRKGLLHKLPGPRPSSVPTRANGSGPRSRSSNRSLEPPGPPAFQLQ